ncbi:MAG: radical SAM protein [Pseudomonadota bacterium]
MEPTLVLINPWIYDFAAYDLWSKPLGLLYLAGFLRACGFNIHLIDCLNIYHPKMKETLSMVQPVRRAYGTGKFWKEKVPKPPPLRDTPKSYSRYGITKALFVHELERVNNPAAVLVTSLMTYWYPGVNEAVSLAREKFPHVPVILGGIYARLCREHALEHSGADHVISEGFPHGMETVLGLMDQMNITVPRAIIVEDHLPYPAFDLLNKIDYICLLTSTGCPYRCKYCATHFLNPISVRRDPMEVLEEILYWHRIYGVKDFAFYDDALLIEPLTHSVVLLENLIRLKLDIRFHTPNALHLREITPDMARLLYLSGFRTLRLGLETSDMDTHDDMDKKVSMRECERAIINLKKAGFSGKEIGAYILVGLPGQSVDSVMETITFVGRTGALPYLAEYSPLPHTPMWEDALSHSSYDLESEPLFHNNSLLPCWDEVKKQQLPRLKRRVQEIRHPMTPSP